MAVGKKRAALEETEVDTFKIGTSLLSEAWHFCLRPGNCLMPGKVLTEMEEKLIV